MQKKVGNEKQRKKQNYLIRKELERLERRILRSTWECWKRIIWWKIRKEIFRRTRKFLETKLCYRNIFSGLKIWASTLVRYSGLFLNWTRKELKQRDQMTRKFMTIHDALISRDVWQTIRVKKRRRKRTCFC